MGKRSSGGKNGNSKYATTSNRTGKRKQQPQLAEHISDDDSDDEEIPEDEAFNSEDELKYGAFFENKDNESDEEDEESDDADDDDEEESSSDSEDDDNDKSHSDDRSDADSATSDDEAQEGDMMDLLDQIEGKKSSSSKMKGVKQQVSSTIANHVKESEFSASVVRETGLTLENLMEEIKDTKGFGSVQQSMKSVAAGKATSAPVASIVSERIKRKVHYEEQSKEVSLWMDAVRKNRNAETLDFRPKERLDMTRDVMVDKFVPTTDFEKQINMALEQAGQKDEDEMLRKEEEALQDDLGTNTISLEEYKRRHGQLAKMRALMFYHEQKRHHINKIKSKKYRKIRKKQREKQKSAEQETLLEADPDLVKELAEKEEYERMSERMTLAHKNTSKWAKRVLKRGKNVDIDTRRALSAQLQRGDDLLKRMNSTTRGQSDDNSDDENDQSLADSARKVLEDIENNDPTQQEGAHKGLFKLSFMQKGIEKQREIAKQEARQLLLELEVDDDGGNSVNERDDISDKNDNNTTEKQEKKQQKIASKTEMQDILADGEMVATSLKMGNSSAVAMTGPIDTDPISQRLDLSTLSKSPKNEKKMAATAAPGLVAAKPSTSFGHSEHDNKQSQSASKRPREGKKNGDKKQKESMLVETSNPWLTVDSNQATKTSTPPIKAFTSSSKHTGAGSRYIDVDQAIDLLEKTSKQNNSAQQHIVTVEDTVTTTTTTTTSITDSTVQLPIALPTQVPEQKITALTQEQLVRKAFSAITDQEAEEEFAKEKALVEEREDLTRKIKKEKSMETVSGWGSWTGAGAPPLSKQRINKKVPAHLQAPTKKDTGTKRQRVDSGKTNVIIRQKRNKTLATNYMISHIPYPYTSREEYERSMSGGIGREWNVSSSFRDMTRPEIITKPGKIIQPISKRVKTSIKHQTPAKF